MGYRVKGTAMFFQGVNLNCGRYCLEALMLWRHGSKYGKEVAESLSGSGPAQARYGGTRTSHAKEVQAFIDGWFKIGFNPKAHCKEYGLVQLDKPSSAVEWEGLLKNYGPLIVAGHIGAVRVIPVSQAGHYVMVVGVSDEGDIEYLDPLRALHCTDYDPEPVTLQLQKFSELAYEGTVLAAAVPF